jgi:site-specific DNA-methyltransferase (adenine-specific)
MSLYNIKLIQGDCLQVMDSLISQGIKVDAIITDPPYGTTACKWDSIIPFDEMWGRLNKLIKPNGAIVLFGSEPFSSALRMSNIKNYKYDWYWKKNKVTGFTHCKNKPMKDVELVSIFSEGTTVHKSQSKNRMTYNPQDLIRVDKTCKNGNGKFGTINGKRPSHKETYTQEFTNYPKMIIDFKSDTKLSHPTQKPVALMEYLIKTYTNENETVLDFTMGSGSTGVACKNTNRKFIGIEMDEKYFEIAEKRCS